DGGECRATFQKASSAYCLEFPYRPLLDLPLVRHPLLPFCMCGRYCADYLHAVSNSRRTHGTISVLGGSLLSSLRRLISIALARSAKILGLTPPRVSRGRKYSSSGRSSKTATAISSGTRIPRS